MAVNNSCNLGVSDLVVYDGAGTFSGRTITGTSNNIDVTNGDGAGGNPTVDVSDALHVGGISFDSGTNVLSNFVAQSNWTPVISGSSVAGVGTYSIQNGDYIRIGSLVIITYYVVWSAHTGSGNAVMSGFPFTSAGTGYGGFKPNPYNIDTPGTIACVTRRGDGPFRELRDNAGIVSSTLRSTGDVRGTLFYFAS